ncbi:MAG: ribosome-associated translation inhibitor RaiA [Eubacteriaceae bacterium]|nr:ribosome-associated translation inhibitor RaiA [Eubacteriaceae bacterium]
MKVIITAKNVNVSDYLKDTIEKKLEKLSKYFSDDIGVNVMLSEERNRKRIEATIKVRGMIFRAEDKADEFYDGIDNVVEKLSSQMSRFKSKLQKKHKDQREFVFAEWPEPEEAEELNVIKTKKFELEPMTVDEAVMQMEMLEHNFFVFLNMETDTVNVVYRRKDKDYGLLETTY